MNFYPLDLRKRKCEYSVDRLASDLHRHASGSLRGANDAVDIITNTLFLHPQGTVLSGQYATRRKRAAEAALGRFPGRCCQFWRPDANNKDCPHAVHAEGGLSACPGIHSHTSERPSSRTTLEGSAVGPVQEKCLSRI